MESVKHKISIKEEGLKMTKTEALILYLCKKFECVDSFGSVVLNKALYYVDNVHYLLYGSSISEFSYVRQFRGPVPREFPALREKMIKKGLLQIHHRLYFGRTQKVHQALENADLKHFNKEEIALIDQVILDFSKLNGTELSNISHQEIAWQLASDGEEMPYYTFLLNVEEPTPKDIKEAKERFRKRKAA